MAAPGYQYCRMAILPAQFFWHVPGVKLTPRPPPSPAGLDRKLCRQASAGTPVAEKPMERSTVALGSLAAFDQATVSVKVPGRLRSISVDLGSVVQQGQLIAQIDPQDYQLRVQQAEAALAQARARLGSP